MSFRPPLLGARGPVQAAAGAFPHPSPPRRHHLYIHRARVPLPPRRRAGRPGAAATVLVPRVPSPHHAKGSSPGVSGHQRPRKSLALVLVSLFFCPGSVSLCNPLGFVFGEGWVPPSRSPRRMGTRRCGAAARGAGWARSFAARARRWHRRESGAGRVPRCLSGSLVLSPPLPRCAHTRTHTHARTHGGGGLSAIASRTEKLCSPLDAPGLQWPPLPCSGPVTRGPCPATAHWPQPRLESPPPSPPAATGWGDARHRGLRGCGRAVGEPRGGGAKKGATTPPQLLSIYLFSLLVKSWPASAQSQQEAAAE